MEEEKKIVLTEKEFISKSMDAIMHDDALNANGMATVMAMCVIATIAHALFPKDEGGQA